MTYPLYFGTWQIVAKLRNDCKQTAYEAHGAQFSMFSTILCSNKNLRILLMIFVYDIRTHQYYPALSIKRQCKFYISVSFAICSIHCKHCLVQFVIYNHRSWRKYSQICLHYVCMSVCMHGAWVCLMQEFVCCNENLIFECHSNNCIHQKVLWKCRKTAFSIEI